MNASFVLTLSCPDRAGIVHAVSGFLYERGANIVEAAQFGDVATGLFFMRVQFEVSTDRTASISLEEGFETVAESFSMRWRMVELSRRLPTVIMVSKLGHCLNDLLFRWRAAAAGYSRDRLQPSRFLSDGGLVQHCVPSLSGDGRHQARGRGEAAGTGEVRRH
jgi:formyltetrahydrofolate hydrolase